eukprot:4963641-Pyramimonas_sp.AAC.1
MRPATNSLSPAAPATDDSMPLGFTESKASAAQPGPPQVAAIIAGADPSTMVVQPGSAAASAPAPVPGEV